MHVLAELHHLHAADRHVGGATQQVEHADAGIAGEAFVDHLQGRHASADDPILAGQVIAFDATGLGGAFGLYQTIIDAMQQGVDLILGQQVLHGHFGLLLQYEIGEQQLVHDRLADFLLRHFRTTAVAFWRSISWPTGLLARVSKPCPENIMTGCCGSQACAP